MADNIRIAAGIVLFNPDDEHRFIYCLNRLAEQFEKIYIFNNGHPYSLDMFSSVEYISENENKGIAYALNKIMSCAKRDGYSWVVTMDQDSVIPDGLVDGYAKHIDKNSNIGIVCPQVIDKRRIYSVAEKDNGEVYVDFCITSAACTSVEAWKKCGKFDEWLFIDLVDNDFCKRLTLSGYKILKLNQWVLDQEFGKIIPKSKQKQEFWLKVSKILHNQNFAKFSYKKFVSPMRVYYTCRNIIYVNKKLAHYGPVGYKENYNCNSYLGFVISFILPSILRAEDKVKVIKAAISGTIDGKKEKVKAWTVNS